MALPKSNYKIYIYMAIIFSLDTNHIKVYYPEQLFFFSLPRL